MAMNLTRPVGTVVSDNAPVGKGPMRDLLNDLVSAIEGKAEIQDSGKLFFDRASAVSAGQEKLVPAIWRIFTVEGDDLVLRGQGQTGDDPLFATSPRWGGSTAIRPARFSMRWPVISPPAASPAPPTAASRAPPSRPAPQR